MLTKVCKQCGEIKPLDQFRKYYGGRKGNYNTCKLCEKINSREKYLASKPTLTDTEQAEFDKIHHLWQCQTSIGLRPPRVMTGQTTPLSESLDELVDKYAAKATIIKQALPEDSQAPLDLVQWLTNELTEEPDFYLDEVYENLQAKYRPQLRINSFNMMPEYDDTYRDILLKILERFNEYEDSYYA